MAEETENKEKKTRAVFDLQIIIIGLVVFLMCMGGSYFMLRSLLAPLLPPEQAEKSKKTEAVLVEVGEFTTNINDVSGTRFLKAEVYLEVGDEGTKKEVEALMPVIKDEILSILSSQTVADLDVRNRENLRDEIKDRLSKRLGGDKKVNGVYFTTFIIQ
ncbi:MAG: flagellar basal body protein FliL [Syntrophomonadaceae bacterium]|nr:flagellar basal body protein FliL [Syntrophomonadaceae bacterium]